MMKSKVVYAFAKAQLIIVLGILVSCGATAQSEKIKGDRNPTVRQTNTDNNLHEVIDIDVTGETLYITALKRIQSSKKMEIRVTVGEDLTLIKLKDDAEISSLTDLKVENLDIQLVDDAKAYLTIRGSNINIIASNSTRSELNIKADAVRMELKDNAGVKALVNSDDYDVIMADRSDARIEGNVKNLVISVTDTAGFDGDKLTAQDCTLTAIDNSTVKIDVDNNVELTMRDKTTVELYNNPKIDIKTMANKATLKKQ